MVSPLLPAPPLVPGDSGPGLRGSGATAAHQTCMCPAGLGQASAGGANTHHLSASLEASPSSHRSPTVHSEGLLQPVSPPAFQQGFTDRPKSQMRDSWWGGASCQAPQAGAFATAPQLLSHSQASPTPAPVLPCALSSPQHVPAAPGLLTRPPASLQEVVLLPSNSCSDLEVAALASRSGKTEYMHIHTHTCLCTHNSLPTCSHPPMRVHTRSPRGVGGEPVKHSVPLPPSPARVYK